MRFSLGLAVEDRLVDSLRIFGCKILTDSDLDEHRKLDFVVVGLPGMQRPLNALLGVQTTLKIGHKGKMSEFFRHVRESPYTSRNLYLELDDEVNLDAGGAFTVLIVITQFTMDRRFADWQVAAVRVFGDLTYEFRDPNGVVVISQPSEPIPKDTDDPKRGVTLEPIRTAPYQLLPGTAFIPAGLEKPIVITPELEAQPPISAPLNGNGTPLRGRITKFDPSTGIGTIEAAAEHGKREFTFSQDDIADGSLLGILKRTLRKKQGRLQFPVAVAFENGNPSAPGKEKVPARKVHCPGTRVSQETTQA